MAYITYTTKAFICGSKMSNTSDKSFLLFTKDAGMLYATARSVREERSRQRYALQDFSLIKVSLVRGKSGWRIGSVENEMNVFTASPTREVRGCMLRVAKLLRQFVHGEDPQSELYADVEQVVRNLLAETTLNAHQVSDIFTLRLLYKLGYVAVDTSFERLINEQDWCTSVSALPKSAEQAIERALHASHL
ncbi:MAG: recombination protein O N-terminal domain-containing protein [Candidatus Paceibacterota bacterium]